jgi:hypothetical protein
LRVEVDEVILRDRGGVGSVEIDERGNRRGQPRNRGVRIDMFEVPDSVAGWKMAGDLMVHSV